MMSIKTVCLSIIVFWLGTTVALPQNTYASGFKHIIVIVQENRTPDNLFHELLKWPGIHPHKYDLARSGINSKGEIIPLQPVPLNVPYDLAHSHRAFVLMYDNGKMDGADKIRCNGECGPYNHPQFKYVDNSDHSLDPYLTLAAHYGWANAMHQTNQGPSYPAHQFIFGGTSAPSAADDQLGIFVSDNPSSLKRMKTNAVTDTGCLAPLDQAYWLIDSAGEKTKHFNNPLGSLCFERDTLATLLDNRNLSWKYYAPKVHNRHGANPGGFIWNAPNSIREICMPNQDYTECLGSQYATNVDLNPSNVLTDIRDCRLANVSWIIPDGKNSDHAGSTANVGGPSWVASIVNAIGSDRVCEEGEGYWSDTAILITWDDWGGWYDHVPPKILSTQQGSYQYGFRVPLVVVSAYTPKGYVNNDPQDFGSILKFIESNFGIPEGALGFADERANGDLRAFFDFRMAPRKFTTIKSKLSASFFINDKRPLSAPDDD
jgi:phospholipase C